MAQTAQQLGPQDPEDDESWMRGRQKADKRWGMEEDGSSEDETGEGEDGDDAADGGHNNVVGLDAERRKRRTSSSPAELQEDENNTDAARSEGGDAGEAEKLDSLSDTQQKEQGTTSAEGDGRIRRALTRLQSRNPFNRRRLLFGSIGGGVAILIITVMFFFLFSLKLVHLAENITVYNMARAARNFRESVSSVTEENIATEDISEGRFAALKERFGETRVAKAIETINGYRPNKVFANLNSETKLQFKDGADFKFLPGKRQVFTGVEYKGTFVEKADSRFFHPIENYREKIRFSAELDSIIEREYKGTSNLVRSQVLKKELAERGIRLFWWEKKGKLYSGLKEDSAEYLEQKQAWEENHPKTPRGCASSGVCEAADAGQKTADTELAKPPVAGENADGVGTRVADKTGQTIINETSDSALQTGVKTLSAVYAVAVPLCLVYDGSINQASGTIDDSETSLEKNFFMLRSAADQQKAGDTTTPAVSSLNGKVGSISNSIPIRRASGATVDSAKEINPLAQPQSSSAGDYSLFDVFLGQWIPHDKIDLATSIAQKGCSVLTDLRVGIVLAAAETALGFVSGGSSEGEALGLKEGVTQMIKTVAEKISSRFAERGVVSYLTKDLATAGGKFLVKTGLLVGGTFGLTELSKAAVLKHANLDNSGLSTNETLANQADMGGNLYGNETNRKFLYGRPLICSALLASNEEDTAYLQQTNRSKSFSERYFALSNPMSLTSHAATTAYVLGGDSANWWSSLVNMVGRLGNLFSMFGSLLTGRVHALSRSCTGAGDYNIVQWGWTDKEEALLQQPDFAPLDNSLALSDETYQAIEQKYGRCYTATMGELLSSGDIQRNPDGSLKPDAGLCATNNLSADNNEFGPQMVLRWRLKHRYDNTLQQLTDIQDAGASTQ